MHHVRPKGHLSGRLRNDFMRDNYIAVLRKATSILRRLAQQSDLAIIV